MDTSMLRCFYILLVLVSPFTQANPEQLIFDTLTQVSQRLSSLQDPSHQDIVHIIKQELEPHIDIERMSKLVLADHWKRASLKQKQRFIPCFNRQLRHNHAQSLQTWKADQWSIRSVTLNSSGSKVAIDIQIKMAKTTRNMVLRMYKSRERWYIYDAAFNGISMLKNFRDDYALRIESQGLGKTLAKLCQQYPLTVKKLVMAANEWPPFIGRSLPGQGFSVELVSQVLTRAGYEVSMAFAPWSQVNKGMLEGKYDISVAAWSNSTRKKQLLFSNPYYHNQLVVVSPTLQINTLDDFQHALLVDKKNLGLMKDYAYEQIIPKGSRTSYHQHYGPLLRKLASKELDMALLDGDVARYFLNSMASLQKHLQVPTITLHSKSLHFTMLKDHPAAQAVISDFNRHLTNYLESDDYRSLLNKYKLASYESNSTNY
jgi:polar amino acid transport system substrate-binding protein